MKSKLLRQCCYLSLNLSKIIFFSVMREATGLKKLLKHNNVIMQDKADILQNRNRGYIFLKMNVKQNL